MSRRFVMALMMAALAAPVPVQARFDVEAAFPRLTFDKPTDIQNAGDRLNRLFVVEQKGVIRVFRNDPKTDHAEVFLDIHKRVASVGSEEGLLGLAFHPQYARNGFLYVNYTASHPARTVIARYRRDPKDANRALSTSETVVLEFNQPYSNHNGGQLAFGPDGYLYIATGDGGAAGDPHRNGQYRKTLLGKILRLDVNRSEKDRPYGIPRDNPFYGNLQGYREEIYAYGLRNPWRMSFDPPSKRLWAGDVGQDRMEEIDLIENGKNYGWNVTEGNLCFVPPVNCDRHGLQAPVFEYGRTDGSSVTGGYVYRGSRLPELQGQYVFGDFVSGRLWALTQVEEHFVRKELTRAKGNISTFGIDEGRELYFTSYLDGKIYRLVSLP